MNKLLQRIFKKYSQAPSNWDKFKEEANRIIKEKHIPAYDLYHYIKQKESSLPFNLSELLDFFHKTNKFNEGEDFSGDFGNIKSKIELGLSDLMKYVNKISDYNSLLKFCRGYGFLTYDLILRCKDEIILKKTNDLGLFKKSFLNKFSYISGIDIIFNTCAWEVRRAYGIKNEKISFTTEWVGKIFSVCGISNNFTIDVTIDDFNEEFVYLLGKVVGNLRDNPIVKIFGRGLSSELIKQIRIRHSKEALSRNAFIVLLEEKMDFNELAIMSIDECRDDTEFFGKAASILSKHDKMNKKTLESIVEVLEILKLDNSLLNTYGFFIQDIKDAVKHTKTDVDYIEKKYPKVYNFVYNNNK